jgi:hypothetical protein
MPDRDRLLSWLRRNSLWLILVAAILMVAMLLRAFLPGVLRDLSSSPAVFDPNNQPAPALPAPAPEPTVTIASIRAAAELATVQYQAVAEVPNERVPDDFRQYLGAKERILLIAYGDVKAGFDLSKLREEDLWTDGTRVQLHLPAPEILSTSMDMERTHIVYYEKSLLIQNDPDLGRETLEIAQAAVRQAALEADLLENASRYGRIYFENFLRSLGFTEVEVIVD